MPEPNPGDPGSQEGAWTINTVDEVLGELKGDPVFKPYEGQAPKDFIGNIVKGYANQAKMIGGDKIVVPAGKLDTEENWNQVYDKLGRPKDVSGYKLERPQLPEGMKLDENLEKAFVAECHKNGILPKQAAAIYKLWNDTQINEFNGYVKNAKENVEKALTELQKEFKSKDEYDTHVKLANNLLYAFGGSKETIDGFIDRYQNDPFIIKVLGNAAKVMTEDSMKLGIKRFELDANDVKTQLDSIMLNTADPLNKAYWDKSDPKHKDAVDKVFELNRQLHGDVSVGA